MSALSELHDDSTSIALYGAYRGATGTPRAGTVPPRPARGHSKDHRPDLLPLVWLLTISADGAVPITYRMMPGNTEDSTTHIATWDRCSKIAGTPSFLYIADSKFCTPWPEAPLSRSWSQNSVNDAAERVVTASSSQRAGRPVPMALAPKTGSQK